jgi:type VI secretion system secreted protein VgrG
MSAAYMKIGGDLIKDALLASVEVTQELNDHWWCTVVCRQTEDKRFASEQCLGEDIKILTYDQDGSENVVFDGFILDVELTYEVWGSYTAQLTAVTRSYKMDLTPRAVYYSQLDFPTISDKLVKYTGLELETFAASNGNPTDYTQWGESDWEFLKRLADDYTAWMRPSAKGVEIFNAFQPGVKLQWREENGLLGFRTKATLRQPSCNGAHYDSKAMQSKTYEKVSAAAEFYDSIKPLVDKTKDQSKKLMPPGYVHQRSRVHKLDEYEKLLKKESVRSIGGAISASGESREPRLKPGNEVEIEGVLDAKGTYGVTKVVHRWTTIGYTNEFWCTPWQNYTNPEAPIAHRWYGVVPARVVDNNDTDGMGRIKVQYFWQEDGPTTWVRMMTPHAGGDRGFMFMPEVGDEVVVAFDDGDPERAVILGCLWNGVDKAPREDFWGGDVGANDVKRIVTKSGHRIQIVDKQGKESITLSTPKKVRISMLESCAESGGRPTMSMYSAGDIYLYAPNGRVHIHSKYFSKEIGGTSSDYFED